MTAPRPTARLRPNADARAIRRGFPWIYDNQLVLDRRTRGLAPGALVRLEDAERQPIGLAALNPASRIAARMLDDDPEAAIGRDWFAARIAQALSLRERLYDTPFYRLVHAEADGLPGVVVDRFGDAAVVQPNAAWAEALLNELVQAVIDVTGVTTVVRNAASRARAAEGLDDRTIVLRGEVAGPAEVPMNAAVYLADLLGGQKTGLYYDQRANHALAARLSKGSTMLDVFSHVGGFSLAALAQGATQALAIDGSAPALDLAARGARASGVSDGFQAHHGDAFDTMVALEEERVRFGTVVCDPPAFAPSKSALDAGLRAYEKVARRAAPLVEPGGFLVLCSCSHAADLARFREASLRGIGRAHRRAQILATGFAGPDHPTHPHLAESGYLKALFLRLA